MSEIKSTDKPRRLFWRRKSLALVTVPVVVILIVLVVLQPWITVSSPQSIMSKACAATLNIQSFRFSCISTSQDSDGFNPQQSIEAEYTSPDRYYIAMTENGQQCEEK